MHTLFLPLPPFERSISSFALGTLIALFIDRTEQHFFHTPPFIPTGCQEILPKPLLAPYFLPYSVKI